MRRRRRRSPVAVAAAAAAAAAATDTAAAAAAAVAATDTAAAAAAAITRGPRLARPRRHNTTRALLAGAGWEPGIPAYVRRHRVSGGINSCNCRKTETGVLCVFFWETTKRAGPKLKTSNLSLENQDGAVTCAASRHQSRRSAASPRRRRTRRSRCWCSALCRRPSTARRSSVSWWRRSTCTPSCRRSLSSRSTCSSSSSSPTSISARA